MSQGILVLVCGVKWLSRPFDDYLVFCILPQNGEPDIMLVLTSSCHSSSRMLCENQPESPEKKRAEQRDKDPSFPA